MEIKYINILFRGGSNNFVCLIIINVFEVLVFYWLGIH